MVKHSQNASEIRYKKVKRLLLLRRCIALSEDLPLGQFVLASFLAYFLVLIRYYSMEGIWCPWYEIPALIWPHHSGQESCISSGD